MSAGATVAQGRETPPTPVPTDGMTDADRNRIIGGIAMMTVKRP